MSSPTIMSTQVAIAATLTPPAPVSLGLGPAVLVVDSDAAGLYDEPDSQLTVSSATGIAALVTSGALTSAQGALAQAMLGQAYRPAEVVIAAYDSGTATEDIADALDRVEERYLGGVIHPEQQTDAVLTDVAAWLAQASSLGGLRELWWHASIQSAAADLLTSGLPAGLSTLGARELALAYHSTATAPHGAAYAGLLAGYPLALLPPPPVRVRLSSVAAAVVTEAQEAALRGNDARVMLPLDQGSPASEVIQGGSVNTAAGTNARAWIVHMWTARTVRDAVKGVVLRAAASVQAITAGADGQTLLRAAVSAVASGLADRGYYTPGVWAAGTPDEAPLPNGWRVLTTRVGDQPTVTLQYLIDREAQSIGVNLNGEIV